MVIMTFGSGFQIENDSPENLNRMKALADYAHEKGIALGGYSLLASRSIDKENDVIMPEGKNRGLAILLAWKVSGDKNILKSFMLFTIIPDKIF